MTRREVSENLPYVEGRRNLHYRPLDDSSTPGAHDRRNDFVQKILTIPKIWLNPEVPGHSDITIIGLALLVHTYV